MKTFQPPMTLRDATLEARKRLNNNTIGTRVKKGLIQIVTVTYDKSGKALVNPISYWLPMRDVIDELNGLQSWQLN